MLINVYKTLLLSLLSILYFLRVEVQEVLFGVEQGWETNRGMNYQLINSWRITVEATASWEAATATISSMVEGRATAGIVVVSSPVAMTNMMRWISRGKMHGYI